MRLLLLVVEALLAVEGIIAENIDTEGPDLEGGVQKLIGDLKKYGDKIPDADLIKLNDAFDKLVYGLKGTTENPKTAVRGATVVEEVSVAKLCKKMKMDAHLISPDKLFIFLKNTLEIIEEAAYQKFLDKQPAQKHR